MSFELQNQETVSEGLRRIVFEQIDELLAQLGDPTLAPDLVVHSTRKSLKRLRAVLRMVRGAIPDELYVLEREWYRDIGRRLGEIRDSAVRIETIDGLIADSGPSEEFDALRHEFVDAHRSLSRRVFEREHLFDTIAAELGEGRSRVIAWTKVPDDFSAFREGLRKVYERGRKDFKQVKAGADAEELHEWRKFAKHLWYEVLLLTPIHPAYLEPLGDALDSLGDFLGKDHDLANQSAVVGGRGGVHSAIAARRARMQRRALQLGKVIYRDLPDDFIARMEIYYRVWRGELDAIAVEAFDPWPAPEPDLEAEVVSAGDVAG